MIFARYWSRCIGATARYRSSVQPGLNPSKPRYSASSERAARTAVACCVVSSRRTALVRTARPINPALDIPGVVLTNGRGSNHSAGASETDTPAVDGELRRLAYRANTQAKHRPAISVQRRRWIESGLDQVPA